jgi:translocation and assembly module TamB
MLGPDVFFDRASVSLHVGPSEETPGEDVAKLRADVHAMDGGSLAVNVHLGIMWKGGVVPIVDAKRSALATVEAHRFRLAAARPFVMGAVHRLDGYLDGKIALRWAHLDEVTGADVEGSLRVTQGVFEIPAIGETFRETELTLVADPAGVVQILGLRATARNREVRGKATIVLRGGEFREVSAQLAIPGRDGLPLAIEGVPLGEVRGRIALEAKRRARAIDVGVEVPTLRVELPQSLGKDVQDLDPNPDITVLQPLGPPEEEKKRGATGEPLEIGIDLGRVHVEGMGADVILTDDPRHPLQVRINEEIRVSGNIRALRGKVEVVGKEFEIEKALVHMRPEEPSNPFVNVTLAWNAPDGTRVYIDYIGVLLPITDEKVKFRSDPPKSQAEIPDPRGGVPHVRCISMRDGLHAPGATAVEAHSDVLFMERRRCNEQAGPGFRSSVIQRSDDLHHPTRAIARSIARIARSPAGPVRAMRIGSGARPAEIV